jgi:hypothetical protein
MKKWGADFGIPEIVVRDYPKQPTIVDFCLVLATRLIKRYKYMPKWNHVPRIACFEGGDMSKTKNGVPWKELRRKEFI